MSAEFVEKKENSTIDVANDDWSSIVSLGTGDTRFQLPKKSKIVDIAQTTDNIEEIAKNDDAIHKSNIEKENKLLKQYEEEKKAKTNVVEQADTSSKKQIVLNVAEKKLINDDGTAAVNQENKGVVDSESPSVKTQTQELATPPNDVSKKESKTGFVKNISKGLAHLYVNKTSKILNPVKFIVDNYKKFSMALFQLGVPAIITWYLMQMPFVSQQIEATGSVMSVVYGGIFYFAVLFLWCLSLFLLYMAGRMIKREAMEVAKIGKEDKE